MGAFWVPRCDEYVPNIVLACSFGAEDVALIDMVHRIDPKTALFYLDTDFFFPRPTT